MPYNRTGTPPLGGLRSRRQHTRRAAPEWYPGLIVRAARSMTFLDGKHVPEGALGLVHRAPGDEPGTVAETCIAGVVFDAQADELEPLPSARRLAVTLSPHESLGFAFVVEQTELGSIRVTKVLPGGPAAQAGVCVGDIIIGVEPRPVWSGDHLRRALHDARAAGAKAVVLVVASDAPSPPPSGFGPAVGEWGGRQTAVWDARHGSPWPPGDYADSESGESLGSEVSPTARDGLARPAGSVLHGGAPGRRHPGGAAGESAMLRMLRHLHQEMFSGEAEGNPPPQLGSAPHSAAPPPAPTRKYGERGPGGLLSAIAAIAEAGPDLVGHFAAPPSSGAPPGWPGPAPPPPANTGLYGAVPGVPVRPSSPPAAPAAAAPQHPPLPDLLSPKFALL
eukprot:TRINITY_DN2827_c0_g1_i2.p1 TRINITY_DN2827_c0_g1~~TRINITY_DN2827_c0_g1_i2.p1  ORF type:complete len:392 (+),score=35.58 TRINITY_DN2827_c0_g1_i2:76-1251(+)